MKKHNLSKLIALAMTGTLLVSPLTALGAVGDTSDVVAPGASVSVNGSGTMEGDVDKEVFCVALPTVADHGSVFNFILDPQDLLKTAAGNSSLTVSGNQLYFERSDGSFMESSEELTVTNKSSVDVDITVEASVDGLGDGTTGVALAEDSEFTDAPDKSIYLALTVDDETQALSAEEPTSITKTLAYTEGSYKLTGSHTGGDYAYELDTTNFANNTDFEQLTFSLSGACAEGDDWKDVTAPNVHLVWSFDRADASANTATISTNPATATWSDKDSPLVLTIDPSIISDLSKGDVGVNFKGAIYTYSGVYNGDKTLKTKDLVSISGNVVTINPDCIKFIPEGSIFYIINSNKSFASKVTITYQ